MEIGQLSPSGLNNTYRPIMYNRLKRGRNATDERCKKPIKKSSGERKHRVYGPSLQGTSY